MASAELVVLIPVLKRPHRVAPVLASIEKTTPEASVLFIPDPDDEPERAAISVLGAEQMPVAGNYAHKLNVGIRATTEPLVFLGADDLLFHDGWLEAAKSFLDDGIGVVGTNDLCNGRTMRGQHATHSLVTREYVQQGTIDEPGKLLHEGYLHEYVDDELVATAKYRGAWAFAHYSIVEHLHPDAGKAPMDDLYAARPGRMRQGRRVFYSRQAMWT